MSIRQRVIDFLSNRMDAVDYKALGIDLSNQTYFKQLAVFIAVSYIANTLSKCEIKTYKGGKEVREKLYYLLNVNPNPNENSSQFMNHLIENYYYSGSALVVPKGSNAIYVADGYSHNRYALKEDTFDSITVYDEVLPRTYRMGKVFYFKLDNREVISLVNGLYEEYGTVLASAIAHFKATNSEKYKLVLDNVQAGDAKFATQFETVIKQQLQTFIESDRGVYPQFAGQDLQRFDANGAASSADIINLRKEVFETVAQAFKIPLSMMQGNITNMNEIVKVYLSICIDPLAQMISEELTRKTTDFASWQAGDRVVVDTSCINHVDILEVADNIDKLVSSGSFTQNEVRKRAGYDPRTDGGGDVFYVTKNYAPDAEALTSTEGGEQNGAES